LILFLLGFIALQVQALVHPPPRPALLAPRMSDATRIRMSTPPTLKDYERFHGMLVGPSAAQRCIASFSGRILFMPSRYSRDKHTFPSDGSGMSKWEVTSLNLFSYYGLVVASLTGLSTLLGCTETIDARAVQDDEDAELPRLKSRRTLSLSLEKIVLDYLSQPPPITSGCSSTTVAPSCVKLVRRFEYHFKLCGIRVMMLHFVSVRPDGKVEYDEEGKERLHLVEVYECGTVYLVSQVVAVGALMAAGARLLVQSS